MMIENDIFKILNELNISYDIQEHKAIFSEEDSKDVKIILGWNRSKKSFCKR